MIISEEQVRLALQYLQKTSRKAGDGVPPDSCTPELLERVKAELAGLPEVRDDRVDEARHVVGGGSLTSNEIAEKIVGRMISDSIR